MKTGKTYLITGAGSGFGKEIALKMAKSGEQIIAGVEVASEVIRLEQEAKKENIQLQVEKLDITKPADRKQAFTWDVDVLLNNAGISLGGSLVDIPEEILRTQYEINVFGTLLLTQGIAKRMIEKGAGKIVFVSSMHGLMADPISGPYCGTKFALEASAEALRAELQAFGVEVAVINPGPYLTGFNDREYESFSLWRDDPSQRLYPYEDMAFPYEQIKNIQGVVNGTIAVLTGKSNDYRTVIPGPLSVVAKKRQKALWNAKSDENLGKRHPVIQNALDMKPATSIPRGLLRRVTKPVRKKKK